MKKEEFFNIGLPKWPALAVVGSPVTREQAMEIIIRTDSLYFSSNDHAFNSELNSLLFDIEVPSNSYDSVSDSIAAKLGIKREGNWAQIDEYKQPFLDALKPLYLNYLQNNWIASSWIGGPHGWCNWNGDIGCRNYNIGKWPSIEDVYNEWKAIAKAFPFLDLKCQLMSHEAGPEDGIDKPVIEFRISDGLVRMVKPSAPIAPTAFGSADMIARFSNPFAERGCTIEMFKQALEYVRNKFADNQLVES